MVTRKQESVSWMKRARWYSEVCSRVLWLSELPKCRERPHTTLCRLERLGRFKCLTTGLDTFLWFLSTSRNCSRNRSPSRLPVSPMYNFLQCASYAVNGFGGGAPKVISDLNGSLGSRHFLYVMNERKSFESWVSAFERSRLSISLKLTSDQSFEGLVK